MAKQELTKQHFSETLKELLRSRDIDKITVLDIVKKSGMNRATYYYHFKDKQDLICWIFDHDFASLDDINNNDTVLDEMLEHLYLNRSFYAPALCSEVQNNLSEHMFRIVSQSISETIINTIAEKDMEQTLVEQISDFLANGMIGSIKRWAADGMKKRYGDYQQSSAFLLQDCIEALIEKYAQ